MVNWHCAYLPSSKQLTFFFVFLQLLDADACLIMANPHAVDQDSEDASNIMRVISVKNSCADKPVIVQLIRFNNKVRITTIYSQTPHVYGQFIIATPAFCSSVPRSLANG